MIYIALYWGMIVIGYFVGVKTRAIDINMKLIDKIPFAIIGALVLVMGLRMGSNKSVVEELGSIGITALGMTILLFLGGILGVSGLRLILGINKLGIFKKQDNKLKTATMDIDDEIDEAVEPHNSRAMTIMIVTSVSLGLILGHKWIDDIFPNQEKFLNGTDIFMTVILCLLLFIIGFTMGRSGTVVRHLRHVGFKILLFPMAVLIGTTIAAIICPLIFRISTKESFAVSYGFGWYSLAPITIGNAGLHLASAVSFLHNIFRELIGIVLIPILANKIGYIEVCSLPGVAAMDVGMPIVEKTTRSDIAVYAFVIGVMESLMVPILVPLALSIF